jgi:hypothetical protein
MYVLGCPVTSDLWAHWLRLFAPPLQPFFVSDTMVQHLPLLPCWTRQEFRDLRLPLSFTDTFQLYAVSDEATWVLLLDEVAFLLLPPDLQSGLLREQLDFGRAQVASAGVWVRNVPEMESVLTQAGVKGLFVWWPSLWASLTPLQQECVLLATLLDDRLPDRRQELTAETWARAAVVLPGARGLAGTFANESGANCFSTVMAAFGTPGVADLWVHPGPFERWLQQVARPATDWDMLGTVLVWRNERAQLQHAAVSLGEGWILQKDAQSWMAPRQVISLADVLARWETPGWSVTGFRPTR